tara:strand:+ start:507 stop:1493 length:987 start_codon:yes stop_codon:yes gene_type:complete
MIVKSFELNQKKIDHIKNYLFYGNNQGLIEHTIKKQFQKFNKNNIQRYEESEIIKNSENIIENLSNKSFFEEEKFIKITRTTDKLYKFIEEVLKKDIQDVTILLISENLEKKSKIRNLFEKSKNAVCVPFYEDNLKTLSLLASNFFKEKNLSLSQQNINLLIERSRGDRINLLNELNKIENYLINKKQIKLEEIFKLTNLSENYNLAELVDYTLAKNQKKLLNILNENNFAGEDSIIILRIFIKKLKRLLKIHLENLEEKNIERTISNFKPTIFWKEKDILKNQLKILNMEKVKDLLKEVNKVELLTKKYPANSINLVTNFVLEQANS